MNDDRGLRDGVELYVRILAITEGFFFSAPSDIQKRYSIAI